MKLSHRGAIAAFLSSILVQGCAPESETSTGTTPAIVPSFYLSGASTTCGGTGANNGNFNGVDRTCLTGTGNILLTLTGSGANDLDGAVAVWNEHLEEVSEMPQLGVTGSGGIPVTIPAGADAYCGETTPGDNDRVGAVVIYADVGGNCSTKKTGTLQAVLRHELAHVLGWNKSHGGTSARTAVTENCVTFLPSKEAEVEMSENVCLHDVEALFRARASGSGWEHDSAYFSSPILWTTNAPAADSVTIGTPEQIPMTQWIPLPGTAVSRSQSSVTWAETSSHFSVDGSGNVTGSSLGSGKLYLKATTSPPSGYEVWTPFKDRGDSVTVTILSAGPFVVDSLVADQEPVIYGGMRTFTVYVSNPPPGTVAADWWIDDPRTTGVTPDTTFSTGGTQAVFLVDPGEYGIEIRVRAKVGGTYSGAGYSIFFFPVCGAEESFAECPPP